MANSLPTDFSWTQWHWHLEIIMLLILLGYFYLFTTVWIPKRMRMVERPKPHQIVSFYTGILVLIVALLSPLAELSERHLFSMHMIQHVLLTMIIPPLLLLGIPGWLLTPLMRISLARRLLRLVTHPLAAFGLFNANLIFWHLPLTYDLAVSHDILHATEHLCFTLTGLLAWCPILSPVRQLPRLNYPGQMLYLFAQSVPMGFLAAYLTFSTRSLYVSYGDIQRLWALSPLLDQQIGGLVMKTAGSLIFLTVLIIVFFRWYGHEQSKEEEISLASTIQKAPIKESKLPK